MSIGAQIVAKSQTALNQMIHDFALGYIYAVERLRASPELENLAVVADIDDQFMAAQIAAMAIGSALSSYPGTPMQRRILLAQLNKSIQPESLL